MQEATFNISITKAYIKNLSPMHELSAKRPH